MVFGLLLIIIGYAVPYCCHHWLMPWLNWGVSPVTVDGLCGYLSFLRCLQIFLVLLGLNLVAIALSRSRPARA